jgi:hypothetical protein
VWYSYVTYQEKQAKEAAAKARASGGGATADVSGGQGGHSTVPLIPPTPSADPGDELVAAKSPSSSAVQRKGGAMARDVEAGAEDEGFGLDHDRGLVRRV